MGKIPFTYSGAVIGTFPRKQSFWKPLIKKIKTKFTQWKCGTLSKSGRLLLIKAVLDAIPIYWSQGFLLSQKFTRLFDLFLDKDVTVHKMVQLCKPHIPLSSWRRHLRGWEKQEASVLEALVQSSMLTQSKDRLFWKVTNDSFTTSAAYNLLDYSNTIQGPWKLLWQQKCPPKVKLFIWNAMHDTLPTLDMLKSRGLEINNICKWCTMEIEDINHLLWECSLAKTGWNLLLSLFEINPNHVQSKCIKFALVHFCKTSKSLGGGTCLLSMLDNLAS